MRRFSHAALMLWRNRRSYMMLSVTIVLSFSLLLGYLLFIDSQIYNEYKEILAAERDIVMTYSWDPTPAAHQDLETTAKKADPALSLYQYYSDSTTLTQYGDVKAKLYFLPESSVPVYQLRTVLGNEYGHVYNYATEIKTILGQDTFRLAADEAIVNETLFYALSPDGDLPVSMSIPVTWSDGKTSYYNVRVVGVIPDYGDCSLRVNDRGTQEGQSYIYLSQSFLGSRSVEDLSSVQWITWMSTAYPTDIADYARSLNMVVHSIAKVQDDAIQGIRAQKQTKGLVSIVLLLLLGINLYSSFSNALNDRKFEIGVKRAIGASGWQIMGQFLAESVLVMLLNILLSVVLVTDALTLYKLWWQHVHEGLWVVEFSPHSLWMFAVCSVTLTVVFSMLFAYKSTRVEIVQYLKAE